MTDQPTLLRAKLPAPNQSVLRLLLVSTSFPRNMEDWRGLFMRHLVDALARSPQIDLSVWAPPGDLPANAAWATTTQESSWLLNLMERGGIAHTMRKGGLSALLAPWRLLHYLAQAYGRCAVDVYHINWLQCSLPLPANGKPALISVLGTDMKLLRLPLMKTFLRRAMRQRKVTICPNADWMEEPLREAFGDLAEVKTVSFGIDPRWYGIQRKLEQGRTKRWLVVTRLTRDKLGPLLDWSEPLFRDGERELHLFGPMQEAIALPDWLHYHGPTTPLQLSEEWFPTAQGLVTLSRHAEGRPQVMLEAMAAALPIIASRIPAHADLIEEGVTGFLCDSVEDYGGAVYRLEDQVTNEYFGDAARTWVARGIGTWDDCVDRYTAIYRQLL
ncbi:MAG: glycosyltransferase family 4 protein, partial [Arenimonas sp.]